MFFQISPVKTLKKQIDNPSPDESEEIATVSLAPFSPNPKLFFEDVPVGLTAIRQLLIRNPTNTDLELIIITNFPDEISVALNWTQQSVCKSSEVVLKLSWTPETEVALRHTIHLQAGPRVKRDIPIVFKSIQSKKKRKNTAKNKGPPTYQLRKKTSPITKKSPKRSVLPNILNLPTVAVPPMHRNSTFGKENCEHFQPQTNYSFKLHDAENVPRRETYVVVPTIVTSSEPVFNDSLEKENEEPTKTPIAERKMKQLQLSSFLLSPTTPLVTPRNNFKPEVFSTEEKSLTIESQLSPMTRHVSLFPVRHRNDSTFELGPMSPYEPHISTGTYIKGNISSETYVKGNISTETYIKGNLSSETYTKGNVSSSTIIKDSPIAHSFNLQLSPVLPRNPDRDSFALRLESLAGSSVKGCIEANLWPENKPNKPLMSIVEESASWDSFMSRALKRKSDLISSHTPTKRANIDHCRITDWSRKGTSSYRVSKKTEGVSISKISQSCIEVTKTDTNQVIVQNPFLFAATHNMDPFMTLSIYTNEEWIEEQEIAFKKWLNALLTPPSDLDAKEQAIEIAKLWKQCKQIDVALAPTKEHLSNKYHINARLNSLRKSALSLFRSNEMSLVLTKVASAIDKNKLSVRQDRDIHLDLALQSEIMSVLLSYNSLWLRIGLETVYNEIIPLNSNSDIVGLSTFLLHRFFRDPYLLKKHKSVHTPKYSTEIKKLILRRFFVLVYFLDQAKNKKLIGHDPCLFNKHASIKESRECLLKFSRETLSSVGDITKYLKLLGYTVQHKQTYINEFDYAVNCLRTDLRDGVRLTKVMEIITMKDGLSGSLRVPAISRLQKVYNTTIAFSALEQANYSIQYEITPKDLVNGHREKTLSFLWQIIYKFQAPLMVKSATTIQRWFRSGPIAAKRFVLREERNKREEAARRIQKWYRNLVLSRKLERFARVAKQYLEQVRQNRAATKIQSFTRMWMLRKKFITIRKSTILIQSYCKKWLLNHYHKRRILAAILIQSHIRKFIARRRFLKVKHSVCVIEERYQANKAMKVELAHYQKLKNAALFMQRKFRANKLAKKTSHDFARLKWASRTIQRQFRANQLMRIERDNYQSMKASTIMIQNWFRATLKMRTLRAEYSELMWATLLIQRKFRSNRLAVMQRLHYIVAKESAIQIQQFYRAYVARKTQEAYYKRLKLATKFIQERFRASRAMKLARESYNSQKYAAIIIQRRYRSLIITREVKMSYEVLREVTITVQRRFRANRLMKETKDNYESLKKASVIIQRRFRANLLMRQTQERYQLIRRTIVEIQRRFRSVLVIQRRFREYKLIRIEMNKFQLARNSAICIQTWYKSLLLRRLEQSRYQKFKTCVINVQRRYRAVVLMREQRKNYETLRRTTVRVQEQYRAKLARREALKEFNELKLRTIQVQRRFRAMILMKQQNKGFLNLKQTTIAVQRRFRAKLAMRSEWQEFNMKKKAATVIQRKFRANRSMKVELQRYRRVKKAVVVLQTRLRATLRMKAQLEEYTRRRTLIVQLQRRFRAKLAMKSAFEEYQTLKKSAIVVQRRFRAQALMKQQLKHYESLRKSTVIVQRWYRSIVEKRQQMYKYQQSRNAIITIQRRYRANVLMHKYSGEYQLLRQSVIKMQRRYKANIAMKKEVARFKQIKLATLTIQRRYRALLLMRKEQSNFELIKKSVQVLQMRFRANATMKLEHQNYQRLKKATILIQRSFRATILMRQQRTDYLQRRNTIVKLQRRVLATLAMRKALQEYETLRRASIIIQRRYRAQKAMQNSLKEYNSLRKATIVVQMRYRAVLLQRKETENYLQIRNSIITIQRRVKATLLMREQSQQFENLRKAALVVQKRYRANVEMKIKREEFNVMKISAVKIQQWYRSLKLIQKHCNELEVLRNAALVLQRRYRARLAMISGRRRFLVLKSTTIMVQTLFRSNRLMKVERSRFRDLKKTVIFVQRHYRSKLIVRQEMQKLKELRTATLVIQRYYRATIKMRQEVLSYEALRKSTIVIQQRYRAQKLMLETRRRYLILRNSALIIQNWWRRVSLARKEHESFVALRKSAIIIQHRFRALLEMRRVRENYQKTRRAIISIQFHSRGFLKKLETLKEAKKQEVAAVVIQKNVRRFLVQKRYSDLLTPEAIEGRKVLRRQSNAAITIQAAWKGYRSRSLEDGALKQIRNRIKTATEKAIPEATLSYRTKQAIGVLSSSSTMPQIIVALEDLDFITRSCPKTCLKMGDLLPKVLYTNVTSISRSLPEMNAATAAVLILVNFSKFAPIRAYSWAPEEMEKIITGMLHCCDKEHILFLAMSTLLWSFAQDEEYRQVIMSTPNVHQKLSKIHAACVRKRNMVKKNVGRASQFREESKLPTPLRTPDWGLDYPHRPRIFTNSVHAIECLLSVLKAD